MEEKNLEHSNHRLHAFTCSSGYNFFLTLVVTLLIGCGLGYILAYPPKIEPLSCAKQYLFIDKGLDCGEINRKIEQVPSLEKTTQAIIGEEQNAQHIVRASVFYRDLETRRWFGIDRMAVYYPASLLKLPIAIMYYKAAEIDANVLDKKLLFPAGREDANRGEYYAPKKGLETGKEYTVRALIYQMLVYSDNNALGLLSENIDPVFRKKVLRHFDIETPEDGKVDVNWGVSVQTYSRILRDLYNASYLSVPYSNEVLETLSQSVFTKGIEAGIPSGTRLANKFGEVTIPAKNENESPSLFLHDCGLVYKPGHPYIVCIMTEGHAFEDMAKVISRISEAIYKIQ